jgi:GNAT superfamily N-acetyltransferase
MKKTKQLDLLLGAVHPDFQGLGLTTLLGIELLSEAQRKGFERMDSHLILEGNFRMRGEMERIGGEVYKRYRIFQKKL